MIIVACVSFTDGCPRFIQHHILPLNIKGCNFISCADTPFHIREDVCLLSEKVVFPLSMTSMGYNKENYNM